MAGIAGKEGQCASKNNCNLSNTRSLLYLQTCKQNSTIRPFLTIANGLVAIGGTECTPHSLLPLVRRGNRVCPSMFCPFIKKGKQSVPLIVLSLHEKGEKESPSIYSRFIKKGKSVCPSMFFQGNRDSCLGHPCY